MRCELREGTEILLMEVEELEDAVRDGRTPVDAEVRFLPGGRPPERPDDWPTGDGWHRVRDIVGLAPLADAPAARFGGRLRSVGLPWLTLFGCGLVSLVYAVDLTLRLSAAISPALASGWVRLWEAGTVGFVPSLLGGGWWTPWTAVLLHGNLFHLVMNLPILAYCGYRVERAMGVGGCAVVVAASVAVATPLICWLSEQPVVGASIVAYGLWGAQITLGLRAGDWIPPRRRGNYGFGNLVFFVPLFLSGLSAEGVSHLGHSGGLLGGVLAAFATPLETAAPAARAAAVRFANFVRAGALALAPCLLVLGASYLPVALDLPAERTEVPGAGLVLVLPSRLAHHELRIGGLPAWSASDELHHPLYAGLLRVRRGVAVDRVVLAEWWHEHTGASVEEGGDVPVPLGPEWTPYAFRLGTFPGFPLGAVAHEQVRTRGRWVWRVGYLLGEEEAEPPAIARWYTHVLESVEPLDPPELVDARAKARRLGVGGGPVGAGGGGAWARGRRCSGECGLAGGPDPRLHRGCPGLRPLDPRARRGVVGGAG